ncbi:MAG: 16S rRNA (cytosine(1402)-N(4))-methyltransferase RsmH [bacterium]
MDMNQNEIVHRTVLLKESLNGLNIKKGDVYLDGTLGGGGHLLEALKMGAKLSLGLDRDEGAITRARARIENEGFSNYIFVNEDFRMMDRALVRAEVEKVDKVMLDLGLSSDQLTTSGRGFSFMKNEPLLMTFKGYPLPNDLTAEKIVNTWDEANIADIIYGWGEERYARRIARAICERREEKPIATTFDLAEIINSAVPTFYKKGRTNASTKTFQALRITVNDEIGALQEGMVKAFSLLSNGGRMAIISFHSIEDRTVKNYFRERRDRGEANVITKKPIIATEEELKDNPRARSAKLRILEKIVD